MFVILARTSEQIQRGTSADKIGKGLAAASRYIKRAQVEKAAQLIQDLLSHYPDNADIWALHGEVCLRKNSFAEAIQAIDQAYRCEPANPHHLVQKARYYGLAGKVAEGRKAVQDALCMKGLKPEHFTILGSVLVRCDDHQASLDCFQRALLDDPKNLEAVRGKATVLRFLGRQEESEAACNIVLRQTSHDYEIQHLRSSLRTQTSEQNHVRELLDLLKSGVQDWRGAVQVAYALTKELEDIGDYDAAFYHLQNGATIRRQHSRYDVEGDIRIFSAIEQAFSQEVIARVADTGFDSEAPIFILGMPRTGSTLVERIISSHSQVTSAGELNDFAIELVSLVRESNEGTVIPRLELPSASLEIPMVELGKRYIQATYPLTGATPYFIDKLPLNFLYVGLIRMALPQAKIVHVKRHPLDACYAIYKYLFKQAYPFSYDLNDLATYYAAYWRLMAHWRQVLPEGNMIEVSYEALVADQEAETRKLIAALGLTWEEACLEFQRNRAASTTGSASQVRHKIYASSVGRWKSYERQLEPLIRKLREEGVSFD